jgi:serine/threonine protein kinase
MSVRCITLRSPGDLPAIGSVVAGKYRIVSRLGSGGSATVSLAVSQGLAGFSKLVVLKSIRGATKAPSRSIDMFLNEARLSARMNHPHVVQVYEVAEHDGLPVIVMEYLDGHSLASILAGALDLPDFTRELRLTIMTKVLAGLHYAHSLCDFSGRALNLVHRDVTPQNVMVTYDGQVKLVDFGVAQVGAGSRRPRSKIAGKLGYMAPEQMHGRCDRRADVFAAGILLWELITLRRFWGNQKEAAVMHQLLAFDIPQRRGLATEMNDELARICGRALAPDPAARYATAAEMQVELERHLLEHSSFVMESTIGQLVQTACGGQSIRSKSTMAPWMGHLDAPLVQGAVDGAASIAAGWSDESAPGVSTRAHVSGWPASAHWVPALLVGLFLCHAGDTAPIAGARGVERGSHGRAEPVSMAITASRRAPAPPALELPAAVAPRSVEPGLEVPADVIERGEVARREPELDVGPRASEAVMTSRVRNVAVAPAAREVAAAMPSRAVVPFRAAGPRAKRPEAAALLEARHSREASRAAPPRAKRARSAKARQGSSLDIEPGMDLHELPRLRKVEDGLLRRER